jgi:hypothetical protein
MEDLKKAIFNISDYIFKQDTQTEEQAEKKISVINDLKLVADVLILMIERQNKLSDKFKEMRKSLNN